MTKEETLKSLFDAKSYNEACNYFFKNFLISHEWGEFKFDFDLDYHHEINQVQYESEGDGNPCHIVFSLKTKDSALLYFMLEGIYSSWDNIQWDTEVSLVEPKEVTVIQYNKV